MAQHPHRKAHPAGIRTEADMWRSLLAKVESEGFDYALNEYSGEVCAVDTQMRALVQTYVSSREAIQVYLGARQEEVEHNLTP
jgi:hypothetical protein